MKHVSIVLFLLALLSCNKEKAQSIPEGNPHTGMDMTDLANIPGHAGHEHLFQNKEHMAQQIENLEKALEKDPNNIGLLMELSRAYIHSDLTNKALPILQKAYGLQPHNAEVVYNLAILLSSTERYQETLTMLELYMKKDSTNVKILSLLADTYRNINNYKEAIETYKKLLALNKDDMTARYNIAVSILIAENDISSALSYLAPLEKQKEFLSEKDSAIELLSLLKEARQKNKKLNFKTYFFNKQLGNIKFDEGNFVEAISYYAKALAEIPFDSSIIIDQGISYRKISDFVSAEKAFQNALRNNNKNTEALFNLGIVHIYDLQKRDTGIAYWKKLIAHDPYFAGMQHLKERIAEVLQGNNRLQSVSTYE